MDDEINCDVLIELRRVRDIRIGLMFIVDVGVTAGGKREALIKSKLKRFERDVLAALANPGELR